MGTAQTFEEVHFSLIIILLLFELRSHEGTEEVIVQLPKNDTYVWKEGTWRDCYLPSGCGNGEKRRDVWCEETSGDKSSPINCDTASKPQESRDCFKPCGRHKHFLRWRTSKWSKCFSIDATSECKEGPGVMKRTATCVQRKRAANEKQKSLQDEECLMYLPKPSTQKHCLVACPQNCIVSEYGGWSECDGCNSHSKYRTRRILVAPENGGKACPSLIEFQPCEQTVECLRNTSPVYEFFIKLEKWSSCIPASSSNSTRGFSRHPVIGYRTRNVSCVNGLGEIVHTSWCTTRSTLPAPTVESCIVSADCQLTEWSQWTLFSEGCITSNGRIYPETRARYREVSLLPEGDGAPCAHLMEKIIVSENLPSCSTRYRWIHSEWGDCMHYDGTCGGGLQRRKLICLRTRDYTPVEESFCKEPRPSEVQQCYVPCQEECLVSPWSTWGKCKPLSMQIPEGEFFGYRQRERHIVQSSMADDCASLVEVDSCQDPVTDIWLAGNWSECLLNDVTLPCGEGIRRRNVSCTPTTGANDASLFCDTVSKQPPSLSTCYIPCPADCVVTEWSEWTPCSATCTSSSGVGVKMRKREILAQPGPGGRSCPPSHQLTETESCGFESCFGYRWEKYSWYPCRPIGNRTCGKGVQERHVVCIHGNEIAVSDKKCAPVMKPASQQACNVDCPVDCVISNFTEWTSCPLDCVPGATQQRVRYVLRHPSSGGVSCPENLVETRLCGFKDDLRCLKKMNISATDVGYRWEIAAWSKCTLTQGLRCGDGYQVRKVSCVGEQGKEVSPHYCLNSLTLPSSSRRCHIFCNQKCALSEWSSWSTDESSACPVTMVRTREASGTVCSQEILVDIRTISPPPALAASEGHWSKCIVNQDNKESVMINGRKIRGICGPGWRYVRGNEIVSCKQVGVSKDMCLEDCPESCQMSEWSEWSACNVTCGQGYKHRQRYVLKRGNKRGRPCPIASTELQEIVCDESCDQYQWVSEEWGSCEVAGTRDLSCGSGIRKRTVTCNHLMDGSTAQRVEESFCDAVEKPESESDCTIPCPDDCIVSMWSPWTKCSEPCSRSQLRNRTRTVLRLPIPSTSNNCPPLYEEEPCILGTNCFEYKWILGDWSTCILPKGAVCGQGMSSRSFACVRNDGKYVHPKHCQMPKSYSLTKACEDECPVDCEVSEWTNWNEDECRPCQKNGQRKRTRYILQKPNKTGQPCPADFVQKVPCPFRSCYHWSSTKWSNCNLQGASCGHGIRTRTTKCTREDGVEVERDVCLRLNITDDVGGWLDARWLEMVHGVWETEACHEPCPGDCLLTAWSNWSLCYRDCSSKHVVGYQTRSRAVVQQSKDSGKCPYALWETKPCWGGPCITFSWKLKDGVILCVRSDGMVAYGGCAALPRPCYPACNPKFSRCNQAVGECTCIDGFSPVYDNTVNVIADNVPRIITCVADNIGEFGQPDNNTVTKEEIVLRYYPDDNEFSIWMYAMICVGSAFVVFVVVTIYLMCSHNPSLRGSEEGRTVRMKSYAAR